MIDVNARPENMTREDLQTVATTLCYLIDAANALIAHNPQDAGAILDMSRPYARWINNALDSVNTPEVGE